MDITLRPRLLRVNTLIDRCKMCWRIVLSRSLWEIHPSLLLLLLLRT